MLFFSKKFWVFCIFISFSCVPFAYGKVNHLDNQSYELSRVVDGDTLELFTDADSVNRFWRKIKTILHIRRPHVTVRVLGINSPESVDPRRPVECGGKEASNVLRNLLAEVDSYSVKLISDSTQPATDVFGRTLAYVELWDKNNHVDLGLEMLQLGYAREFTYNKTYDRRDRYVAAEQAAKNQSLGIWSREVCPNSTKTKP